jgi:hypothetical protein
MLGRACTVYASALSQCSSSAVAAAAAAAAAAALQVQKIRLLLRQRGLGAVRVGTVDDYQVRQRCTQKDSEVITVYKWILMLLLLTKPLPEASSSPSTAALSYQCHQLSANHCNFQPSVPITTALGSYTWLGL